MKLSIVLTCLFSVVILSLFAGRNLYDRNRQSFEISGTEALPNHPKNKYRRVPVYKVPVTDEEELEQEDDECD